MECLYCKNEFEKSSRNKGMIQKYCCREHYLAHKEEQRKIPTAYCETCGNPIFKKSHQKNGKRRYCSIECMNKSKQAFNYVVCQYCGKSFKEKRESQNLYCSKKCSDKARSFSVTVEKEKETERITRLQNRYKELMDSIKPILSEAECILNEIKYGKNCANCGVYFIATSSAQKCCCHECQTKYSNRMKDKRIYRNGKPDLSISLKKLYDRDGGVCQICGRKINFDCDPNSKCYPSIDHIKPLSKGGLHEWNNIQLACRQCNDLKGDRSPL